MRWVWPLLRLVWGTIGTVIVGLLVTGLYSLMSRQPLPDLQLVNRFLVVHDYWLGGGLALLGVVSFIAHRQHSSSTPRRQSITRPTLRERVREFFRRKAASPTGPGQPPIVGRDGDLAKLRGWFAEAQGGTRRIIFVSGEPGIGKTTLVGAFFDSLVSDKSTLRIGRGQCVEQYGAGEPYMPLLDALTRLCREADGRRIVEILHRIAPAWLAQMPSLIAAEDRAKLQGQAQGVTQARMLREMAEALAAIASDTPLVLLFEDLHWSDFSTLELIATVARRTEPAKLLILGTYRPVEMLAGDHPLRKMKAELELHHQCEELPLKLLSEADVGTYLNQRFDNGKAAAILRSADSAQNDLKGDSAEDGSSSNQAPSSLKSFRSERGAGRAERGISAADTQAPLSFPRAKEESASLSPGSPQSDQVARGIPDTTKLANAIYARSDGNPLFMVNIVDYLEQQGSFDTNTIDAPHNIKQMIERNLERLSEDDQRVLEAASVTGAEFSAAAVAAALERPTAEVEACCTRLSRQQQFINRQGSAAWPDGTIASNFRFHHALYQDVLYDRLPDGHRVAFHRRIAQREETGYGDHISEIAAELANHYRSANEKNKAIEYFTIAGQQAAARAAHSEAAVHFTAALTLLETLLDNAERIPRELTLQMALAPELIAIKGWGSAEMVRAFTRARELCRRLGDPTEVFPVLCGVCAMHYVRGELTPSRVLAEELLQMAQATRDSGQLRWAHSSLATCLFNRGDLLPAKEHNDAAVAAYDRAHVESLRYTGISPGVVDLSYRSWILWHLGYPDQALRATHQACALGEELGHPDSLVFALGYATDVHLLRGEIQQLQETARRNVALCAEHGLATFLAAANIYLGWAMAAQGREEDGLGLIREGLAAMRAQGFGMFRPRNLGLHAEACLTAGRYEEGLQAVADALAAAEPNEEGLSTPELHRLKGELLLRRDSSRIGGAQGCFERAIAIARAQSAKSFELRATTSLARLLASQGNREEVRTMLAAIYGWFTEGFDTADLKDARALLDLLDSES